MSSKTEYILSLNDQVSATMQKITGKSDTAIDKFSELKKKTEKLQRSTQDFGGSISTLKQKIDILQNERDLINPKNLTDIKRYNTQIKKLNKNITSLETVSGSKFSKYKNDALGALPPFLTNPAVLVGAGVAASGKLALGWEEGMAQINSTARLSQDALEDLSSDIMDLGVDAGGNLSRVPAAYEKIISQVGDVTTSTEILESALYGAKAGFTDVDIVAGAVAQSLSAVGKENTNASEVIDTLFAAKRVGAGEFRDFANYIPKLIPAAQAVGTAWQDTAGLFAYMTGKGQSAEAAATGIQNAFTALGKSDIQNKMKSHGISVFNEEGDINAIENIMQQLNSATAGMNDKQKSNFLESIGLTDAQAKNAFSVLSSDVEKLQATLSATRAPAGELDEALANTENASNRLKESWAKMQGILMTTGGAIISILNPALDIAMPLLDGIAWTIGIIGEGFGWWFEKLGEGNFLIWEATTALAAFTIAINASSIATKLSALWTGIAAAATKVWTATQWLFNAALWANPITWIIAGVSALIALIYVCVTKVQGWGAQWDSIMNFMKLSGKVAFLGIKLYWQTWVSGFMIGINKIKEGWYSFKNAVGLGDEESNNAAIAKIRQDTEARKQAWLDTKNELASTAKEAKSALTWELSLKKGEEKKEQIEGAQPVAATPALQLTGGGANGAVGGSPGSISGPGASTLIDLNNTNIKGSTNYGAIAAKLGGIKFGGLSGVPEMSSGTMSSTDIFSEKSTEKTGYQERAKKSVNFDKFCESIVINIKEGVKDTDELVAKISKKIVGEFNEALEYGV